MTSDSRGTVPGPRFHDLGSTLRDPEPEDPHHAAYRRLDSAIYVSGRLPYVDGRAIRLADRIEAEMVGINRGRVSDSSAPLGGVKQRGISREGAREKSQDLSVGWSQ